MDKELRDHNDEYYRFRALLNKTPKTWNGVFIRFAEYTSFQGIPFIYRSRYIYTRLIWIFFFICALVCTILHYYLVANKFFAREVTTKVTVGYSDLPFPSVTVCNINPIRESAVTESYQSLHRFLDLIELPEKSRTTEYLGPGSGTGPCQLSTREFGPGGGGPPWQSTPVGFRPPPGPPHRRGGFPNRGGPFNRGGPPNRVRQIFAQQRLLSNGRGPNNRYSDQGNGPSSPPWPWLAANPQQRQRVSLSDRNF